MNKKGVSEYISWILIFGMVVMLSFVLFNWSMSLAKQSSEDLQTRTDPLICSEIGISIEGICQSFKSIEMNISNINSYEITGFLIRTVGLYPDEENYLDSNTVMTQVEPGETEKISILKSGTLSQVQIIPMGVKNNKNIYCEEQSVKKEKKDLSQC